MTFEATVGGTSATDLSALKNHFVKRDPADQNELILAIDPSDPDVLGVLTNAPKNERTGNVRKVGFANVKFAEAGIKPGEPIALNTSGQAVKWLGQALPRGTYEPQKNANTQLNEVGRCLLIDPATHKGGGTFLAVGTFDGTVVANQAIGSHPLGAPIPSGAQILQTFIHVKSTFASNSGSDLATLQVTTGAANHELDAAIAIGDGSNPWDAGAVRAGSDAVPDVAAAAGDITVVTAVETLDSQGLLVAGVLYALA